MSTFAAARGLVTRSNGPYLIPAGPGLGTSVSSSTSADTYGSWVEMAADVGADILILGAMVRTATSSVDYVQLDIGTGANPSEISVGEQYFSIVTNAGGEPVAMAMLDKPIFVADGTRLSCRTADENASAVPILVTLLAVAVSDLENL
jgi:hypothetical protein